MGATGRGLAAAGEAAAIQAWIAADPRREALLHDLRALWRATGTTSRDWNAAAARERLAGKLDSLSPLAVLSRGYALVWNEEGRLVRQPAEVRVGEALRIRVSGGALGAVVTSREGA